MDLLEVIRQAPLLKFCAVELSTVMEHLSTIPKMTVMTRHMHIRTLVLSQFPSHLLRGFLDALELPALEVYFFGTHGDGDIAVDNVISLLNRSGLI